MRFILYHMLMQDLELNFVNRNPSKFLKNLLIRLENYFEILYGLVSSVQIDCFEASLTLVKQEI